MKKKYAYYLFGIFLLFGSCSLFEDKVDDENKIDEGEVIEIKDQELSFSIFQIVSIDLGETAFSDGQIVGTTLEGEKVNLFIEDNILNFMVPKLNQGSYKLVFSENGNPFNIAFQVKAHTLKESPDAYLEKYKNIALEQIEALEKIKGPVAEGKEEESEKDIAVLKQQAEEQFAKAALLNESDLADMAYFFEANNHLLEEILNIGIDLDADFPEARLLEDQVLNIEQRAKEVSINFLKSVIRVVASIGTVYVLGQAGSIIGEWVNPAGAVLGAGIGVTLGFIALKNVMKKIDNVFSYVQTVADEQFDINLRADYVFENGTSSDLLVYRNYRTIYSEDKDSNIPYVKNFVLGLQSMSEAWDKLLNSIPLTISYKPINPASLNDFQTTGLRVHSEHLSISEINNTKVTGSAKKENGKLLLTFNTSEEDAQEFSFNLIYENADFGKLEKELNAAVINEGCNVSLELKDKNKVTATATGYGPFTFTWSSGQKEGDKSVEILASQAGEFEVTVTDQNDCESTATLNIPCTLAIDVQNNENTFTIDALDGLAPFSYTWSTGVTSKTQTLSPGTHTVIVSDALGCKIEHTISINCDLEVNIQKDGNNVTAQPSGGTAPYTYVWSNGSTTASQSNLAPGTYAVVVKDNVGCEKTNSITISCNMTVDIQKEGNNVTAQPSGGTAPYTYTWSNGATTASQSNLAPGTYSVVVKDKVGCEKSASVSIDDEGPEFGSFTDPRDGNVYKTVKIGTQIWFAENLRYADGIPHVPSADAWKAIFPPGGPPTDQPAWSNYNNDPNKDSTFGKLYNWNAVNTGRLCPQGWHIPTDAEWFNLTSYLGQSGDKMKSVTGWETPTTSKTNESGFTALPGGFRNTLGEFSNLGSDGYWWSSSSTNGAYGAYYAWNRSLGSRTNLIHRSSYPNNFGLSCRCLKD